MTAAGEFKFGGRMVLYLERFIKHDFGVLFFINHAFLNFCEKQFWTIIGPQKVKIAYLVNVVRVLWRLEIMDQVDFSVLGLRVNGLFLWPGWKYCGKSPFR